MLFSYFISANLNMFPQCISIASFNKFEMTFYKNYKLNNFKGVSINVSDSFQKNTIKMTSTIASIDQRTM